MPTERDPAPSDADLATRLAAAEQALEAVQRQQEIIAYGISHDLRAPLRAISGYAQLLAGEHAAQLDDEGRGYLARIREAAGRMDGLIEGLMQLSHALRVPLRPTEVDVSMLAEWSLVELQDADPTRAVQAQIQPDLVALGDERLLRQMFQRLLHNAWKFAPDDAPVQLQVTGELARGRTVLTVHDAGRGFDMRHVARLFEPFKRLHPPELGGGHGLGLAIVDAVVERHGGSIQASSAPGAGCTFRIELPAPVSEAAPA